MSHGGVDDPLQRSRLKIQVAFCLGIRHASHLSPVVNRIRTTIENECSRITIGLNLGDRRHRFCALDGKGQVIEEGTLSNKRESLSELSRRYRRALVVMEAGCHSPWISLGPRFIRLDCRRTTSATSNRNPLPPFAGLPCRFCRRSPRRPLGRSSVSDRAQRVRVSFPLASARSFRQA